RAVRGALPQLPRARSSRLRDRLTGVDRRRRRVVTFATMKLLALASLLAWLLLAASACGSSHPAASNGLHSAAYRSLPHSLRLLTRRSLAKPIDGPTHEI